MKIILCPTDFSAPALNAVQYGAELAWLCGAKLVLLHACHVPVVAGDMPMPMPDLNAIEADALERLDLVRADLRKTFGTNLQIDCVAQTGFAVEVIRDYCHAYPVSYVVMGMQGSSLGEKLMGSVTTALLRHSKTPVLSIATGVRFRNPKRMVLATDSSGFENPGLLSPVGELARVFNGHVYVLHIVKEREQENEVVLSELRDKLAQSLGKIEHSFHTRTNTDVMQGINDFAAEKNAGLVITIPKKTAFQSLFNSSISRKMAFHTDLPLLTLHE